MTHLSHPDQLMAAALGVCWHSPTSDRWPCQRGYFGSAPCNCDHAVPEVAPHNYHFPPADGPPIPKHMREGGLNADGTDGWPAPGDCG